MTDLLRISSEAMEAKQPDQDCETRINRFHPISFVRHRASEVLDATAPVILSWLFVQLINLMKSMSEPYQHAMSQSGSAEDVCRSDRTPQFHRGRKRAEPHPACGDPSSAGA